MDTDELLSEQKAYYRARAPEYDDWWNRRGRYDRGPANTAAWEADVAEVRRRLDEFAPTGSVLELAAGTGNWTAPLLRHADRVVAVDASRETLEVNKDKLGDEADRVDYVVADLFAWEPTERFDVIFMGFWLTHVPDSRFEHFWSMVADGLAASGRVFIVDNSHPRRASGVPNSPVQLPTEGQLLSHGDGEVDLDSHVATRELGDGRRFDIVKRYWEPGELGERLAGLGWAIHAEPTRHFFLTAQGSRA